MILNNAENTTGRVLPAVRPSGYRAIVGGSIGHFIEWYEFAMYGFLGGILAAQIFPSTDPTASLIASFSAFAIGFVGRPIGALVLSPLCDKYGRRKLLSTTIMMAGAGSLVIGLCPTFAAIGVFAPLIVCLARFVQGLSAGGEFQIAITFLNEHVDGKHRAFAASPQTVCIGIGILTACAIAGILTHVLPQKSLFSWGWRIPFLLGAVMSLYGVLIRRELGETPAFRNMHDRAGISLIAILRSLAQFPKEVLLVFVLEMNVVQYILFLVFLPTYAHMTSGFDTTLGLAGTVIGTVVYCFSSPLMAYISDRVGRKPMFITGAILFLVLTYPLLFLLSHHPGFMTFVGVASIGAVLVSITGAPFATALAELFPTRVRATGIGVPYAVSVAIFGGTTPLLIVWLQKHGGILWVSAYVMAICITSLVTYFTILPETRGRSLSE
jgi:MFS transporter, MHS family, alpha-ketoglutarate permease